MGSLSVHIVICTTFASLLLLAPKGEAMDCQDAVKYLVPCISYLRGSGGPVPGPCCNGVRGLNDAATTTPDRRTACVCIKKYAGAVSGLNPSLVGSLPESCGVHLPFVPTPTTDCNRLASHTKRSDFGTPSFQWGCRLSPMLECLCRPALER